MTVLNKDYWERRYKNNETQWEIGEASSPLKTYIDNLSNNELKVLIPGCGNAFEAKYLLEKGFLDVTAVDISQNACERIVNQKILSEEKIICDDFFNLKGEYDLIIEQTFFCALDPNLREDYVKKMHSLLKKDGVLAGLLFDFPLTLEGPPFGGDIKEYRNLFSKLFTIHKLEECYNSIKPRAGKELFIELKRK